VLIQGALSHLTEMRGINRIVSLGLLVLAVAAAAQTPNRNGTYIATAYSVSGKTASGVVTQRHIVAADPDILPIGSRITIRHAGRYSGEYVVADTGEKIEGRKLDIYMPNSATCMKFGKKAVRVRVIQLGDGTKHTTEQAQSKVKQDVQADIAKKAVGNAATEDDWVAKKGTGAAAPASNAVAANSGAAVVSTAPQTASK
jgi:3D (Asp-Asp-Asp) domain-containing protein